MTVGLRKLSKPETHSCVRKYQIGFEIELVNTGNADTFKTDMWKRVYMNTPD